MNRWSSNLDLIVVSAATIAMAALVTASPDASSPARTALAFAVILLAPGYALHLLLFPRRAHLNGVERAATSLGLSVAAVPLVGVAAGALPWGFTPVSSAWGLAAAVLGASLAAAARRGRQPRGTTFAPAPGARGFWPALGLSATVFAAGGAVVALSGSLAPPGPSTEFYVLGADGTLEAYPQRVAPGETFTLRPGVVNHDAVPRSFELRVPLDPARLLTVGPLAPGARWEAPLRLTGPDREGCVAVDLELYRAGEAEVHRLLQVVVPIVASEAEGTWFPCRS